MITKHSLFRDLKLEARHLLAAAADADTADLISADPVTDIAVAGTNTTQVDADSLLPTNDTIPLGTGVGNDTASLNSTLSGTAINATEPIGFDPSFNGTQADTSSDIDSDTDDFEGDDDDEGAASFLNEDGSFSVPIDYDFDGDGVNDILIVRKLADSVYEIDNLNLLFEDSHYTATCVVVEAIQEDDSDDFLSDDNTNASDVLDDSDLAITGDDLSDSDDLSDDDGADLETAIPTDSDNE